MKRGSYDLTISSYKQKRALSVCNDAPMHLQSEESTSKSADQASNYSSSWVKCEPHDVVISPHIEKRTLTALNSEPVHSEPAHISSNVKKLKLFVCTTSTSKSESVLSNSSKQQTRK